MRNSISCINNAGKAQVAYSNCRGSNPMKPQVLMINKVCIQLRACSAAVHLAFPTLCPTGHSFIEQVDRDGDKDGDNRREQYPLKKTGYCLVWVNSKLGSVNNVTSVKAGTPHLVGSYYRQQQHGQTGGVHTNFL